LHGNLLISPAVSINKTKHVAQLSIDVVSLRLNVTDQSHFHIAILIQY